MGKRPIVVAAMGAVLGILLSSWGKERFWLVLFLFGLVLVIGGMLFLFWKRALIPTIFLLFMLGFATYTQWREMTNLTVLHQGEGIAFGQVMSVPEKDGDRLKFRFRVDSWKGVASEEEVPLTIRLRSKEEWQNADQIKQYQMLRLPIRLEAPEEPSNPGEFDYRSYLWRQGIHWLATGEWGQIEWIGNSSPIGKPLNQIREKLSQRIKVIFSNPTAAGFFQTLLLGQRNEIDPEWEETYSALGLVHILSISGLHISFLLFLCYEGAKLLGFTREKAVWISLLFLPCYLLLTGADAPALRAAMMGAFTLLAIWWRKTGESISYLAFALLLLLTYQPWQIYEVGFQLTFLVTAGLLLAVEPLSHQIPLPFARLRIAVAVSLVAQTISFPLLIAQYHEYSLLSGIVNLLLVPYFALLLPIGIGLLLLSLLFLTLTKWIAEGISWSLDLVQNLLEWILQHKWHLWTFPTPGIVWFCLYILVAWGTWYWWAYGSFRTHSHLPTVIGLITLLTLGIWASKGEGWMRDHTRITLLDVGQGDAILIQTEDGKNVLIDAGGTIDFTKEDWQKPYKPFEVGERKVVPTLKALGVSQLDVVVLSHGDVDHIGGLLAVVERFPVGMVWRNAHLAYSWQEQKLMSNIHSKHIPVYTLLLGQTISIGSTVHWQVLHPRSDRLIGEQRKTNNDSLVGLLQIYQTRVLLTGDIEKEAEDRILSEYQLPNVDLLKVAHHGSKTSTQEKLLKKTKPKVAVISVGKENRYGHPHADVIRRLTESGTHIYRTDQQGAITVQIHPDHYQIETMK